MIDGPTGPWVVVAAIFHPELVSWVWEHAHDEAARQGWEIDSYLGRETDVLPAEMVEAQGLCFHAFSVRTGDAT